MQSAELTLVILAGGASRRMGRDKALLPWPPPSSGEIDTPGWRPEHTWLSHLIDIGCAAHLPVWVVGRSGEVAAEVRSSQSGSPEIAAEAQRSVRFLPDAEPGLGPLGGLATALTALAAEQNAASTPRPRAVLVIACDLPGLRAGALTWLAARWQEALATTADALDGLIVHDATGEPQPLFAIYAVSVLPTAQACIAEGKRSLRRLIAAHRFASVAAPAWLAPQLRDVDAPGDLPS